MTHSDDDGLIIPPKLAPQHAVIVPFYRKKDDENAKVRETCTKLEADLNAAGIVTKFDGRDGRPGAKFYENERKGVCLRIGVGPRDIQNNVVEYKRRDQSVKQSVSLDGFVDFAQAQLNEMQSSLFEQAKERRTKNTLHLDNYDEFKELMSSNENKFVMAHWDGTKETEAQVKQDCGATIRCIPLPDQGYDDASGKCMVTGKDSEQRVVWAKAY